METSPAQSPPMESPREARAPAPLPATWKKVYIPIFVTFSIVYFAVACYLNKGGLRFFLIGSPPDDSNRVGALSSQSLQGCKLWQMLTFIPLHSGIINMIPDLEAFITLTISLQPYFSFGEILLVYLSSAFCGGILAARVRPSELFTGGSAACSGLIGSYIAIIISDWSNMENRWKPILVVLRNLMTQALMVLNPNVSIMLSVASMITGFSFGLFSINVPFLRRWRRKPNVTDQLPTSTVASEAPEYTMERLILWLVAVLLLFIEIIALVYIQWSMDCLKERGIGDIGHKNVTKTQG